MEAQQVSEAESARERLQDLQDQIAGQKASKQELEAELERQKQVKFKVDNDQARLPTSGHVRRHLVKQLREILQGCAQRSLLPFCPTFLIVFF